MKTNFPKAALLSLVAVAACSPVQGVDEKGITATFSSNNAQSFVAGYQPVELTVTKKGKSVEGYCEIKSPKYSAKFSAPQTVNIPANSQVR